MFKTKFALLATLTMTLGTSFVVYAETGEPKEFVIYHTNDTHSRVDVFPYVEALIKESEAEGSNTLYFDAGDTFHGQPVATTVKGESVVNILNSVDVLGTTTGNHEYNYGLERLQEIADELDFPMVASNVYFKGTSDHIFDDYFVFEEDGVKFGVFGLATPETAYKASPDYVANINFADPVEEAERVTKILKEQEGCDVVISLAHLGVDESTLKNERSTYVAEKVDGIDIMIDGHSHTEMPEGIVAGDTLVVQTGEYGNNIGKISFNFENDDVVDLTAELIATKDADGKATLVADEEVAEVVATEKAAVDVVNNEVVASTPYYLEGTRALVRTQETNLGDLITDSMLDETGADVALHNGGSIRASIEAGDITKGDVVTVLPFGNIIITQSVTGAELLETLEHSYSSLGEPAGFFGHIAGMNVVLDPTAEVGSRIVSATFDDGSEVDPNETYTLATNDFLASGGDDYTMLAVRKDYTEYTALDEVLIDYLNSGKAEINEEPAGRITILEADVTEPVIETKPAEPITPEKPVVKPITPEKPVVKPVNPQTPVTLPAEVPDTVYVVVAGDTLSEIAYSYHTTYQVLAQYNNIKNPDLIYVGDKIKIPAKYAIKTQR